MIVFLKSFVAEKLISATGSFVWLRDLYVGKSGVVYDNNKIYRNY